MIQLTLAALFFCGLHFAIAGTRIRDVLVDKFGEKAFRAGFSILSLLGLGWLIFAYGRAPYLETWGQPAWFKPVAAALMLPAFLLAVAGITTPNPTAAGAEAILNQAEPARGILRITRHPLLWGMALWASVHLVANGDAAALVLFGSLLVLVMIGTRSIDAKRRRAFGAAWERFAATTSNVPFVAIAQGRSHWKPSEIGLWRPLAALVLYLAMLYFHGKLFGISALW